MLVPSFEEIYFVRLLGREGLLDVVIEEKVSQGWHRKVRLSRYFTSFRSLYAVESPHNRLVTVFDMCDFLEPLYALRNP